jgi:hypothetical protein
MIDKLKSAISRSILLTLVVAPYLINATQNSAFILPFLWLILGVVFIDFVYQKLSGFILRRFGFDTYAIFIPSLIIFFYYEPFVLLVNLINSHTIQNPLIRARYYIPIIFIILIISYQWIRPLLRGKYILINSFLIIFSGTLLLPNPVKQHDVETPFGHFIPLNGAFTKPVILIILDEYASPNELYKNKKDSSIFNFNNTLISYGWQVKDDQYSDNLTTAHSLSSLFNYNYKLKDSSLSIDQSILNLRRSTLLSDLQKKGVSLLNFGIFDINKYNAFTKIYFYENEELQTNFLKKVFAKSILGLLYESFPGSRQLYYNRTILEHGYKKIMLNTNQKTFIYLHLLMPHSPLEYKGYRNFELSNPNLENYISYWLFTNSLVIEKLVNPLMKSNKFKIIMTGDHGYRGDNEKVNAHKTFTAYYGFDPSQVAKVKSVQDLGSLIYASY